MVIYDISLQIGHLIRILRLHTLNFTVTQFYRCIVCIKT